MAELLAVIIEEKVGNSSYRTTYFLQVGRSGATTFLEEPIKITKVLKKDIAKVKHGTRRTEKLH